MAASSSWTERSQTEPILGYWGEEFAIESLFSALELRDLIEPTTLQQRDYVRMKVAITDLAFRFLQDGRKVIGKCAVETATDLGVRGCLGISAAADENLGDIRR